MKITAVFVVNVFLYLFAGGAGIFTGIHFIRIALRRRKWEERENMLETAACHDAANMIDVLRALFGSAMFLMGVACLFVALCGIACALTI